MTTEKPILIYICGPYSFPDPASNVRRAIAYADTILQMGLVPFVPHLTHLWEQHSPKPYADWLAYDMHWLRLCNVVFRFDGESNGADLEVAEAKRLGIPVVTEIAGLLPFVKYKATFKEVFEELRRIQGPGKGWDAIADPDAYIREMRGE